MLSAILPVLFGAAVSGLIHFYVYRRLLRPAELPRRWHRAIVVLLIVMYVAIPVTTGLRYAWPAFTSTVGWLTYPWLALAGLMFVIAVGFDLMRLVTRGARRLARRPADPTMSRRVFLARVSGGAALTVASSGVAKGMMTARGTHEIVDVEITLAKLPKALDGFTIVQLSDLHVGLTIDRAFVQKVVDHTNALSPVADRADRRSRRRQRRGSARRLRTARRAAREARRVLGDRQPRVLRGR